MAGITITGLESLIRKHKKVLDENPKEFARMMKRIAQITVAKSVSNCPISPTKGQYEASVSRKKAQKKADRTGKPAKVRFKSNQQKFNPGGLQRSIKGESTKEKAVVFVASNAEGGKYADKIHNTTYNLGIGSEAKKGRGNEVGPKFIERAISTMHSKGKYVAIIEDTVEKIQGKLK